MSQHPILSLYSLLKEEKLNEHQHLEKVLSRLPNIRANSAISPGVYWFIGKTVNDGDGNTTYSKGKITVSEDLRISGEVNLEEGTNYNPATSGRWDGKTISGGLFQINEVLPTHDGVFIYSGKINNENGEITGSYYWDIRPAATGQFTFRLFTSLPEDFEGQGIKPMELCGISGYEQEIARSHFCWRWFHRDNYGDDFRVITLEENGEIPSCTLPPHIRPRDLVGTNGFSNDLEYSFFCWRWFKRNGEDYKVLTIEDPPYLSSHEGSHSVLPKNLAGVNGYSNEAKDLRFCWRWLTKGAGSFRVVTLE